MGASDDGVEASLGSPDRHNLNVVAEPAVVTARAGGATISITSHLWITWAGVAIDNLLDTRAARLRALQGGPDMGDALTDEMGHGMVAICSVAFAGDGLLGAWTGLVMPPDMIVAWRSRDKRSSVKRRMREVLKHGIAASSAGTLADRWEQVFDWRGGAVHFLEHVSAPEPHPTGTHTAPEVVKYGLENAETAVTLLLDTIDQVIKDPKPAMREWASRFLATAESLHQRHSR